MVAVFGGGERDLLLEGLALVVLLLLPLLSTALSPSPVFSTPRLLSEGGRRAPPLCCGDGGGLGLSICVGL